MKKIFLLLAVVVLIGAGCNQKTTESTKKGADRIVLNSEKNELSTPTPAAPEININEEIMFEKATIKTNLGDIVVEFYGEDSPKTVKNFQDLASDGFYNNVKFHRIIDGFMIQSGDPLSKDDTKKNMWGTGGPGYKFEDEFNNHKLVQGSLAMANSGPNTNGSQFFIVTVPSTPSLDGKHTNFGQVIEGLDVVEKISKVETNSSDQPLEPVIIESIELE